MLSEIANNVPMPDNIVERNGKKYCAKCGDCVESTKYFMDTPITARYMCRCLQAEVKVSEDRLLQERNTRNRHICFRSTEMFDWNFENDDKQNKKLSDGLRKYADNFDKYLKENKGILFYGTVGTGKSYYAACIANKIIDKGYTCKMTNFTELVNSIQGTFEGKNAILDEICKYSLLILDDLGTERQSEYMQEQVFSIINARYNAKKPMIITTNLDYSQILTEQDVGRQRIYDRIVEQSMLIEMNGVSRRMKKSMDTSTSMKAEMGL